MLMTRLISTIQLYSTTHLVLCFLYAKISKPSLHKGHKPRVNASG